MYGTVSLDEQLSFEVKSTRVNVLRIHPHRDGKIFDEDYIQLLGSDLLQHIIEDSGADYVLYFGDVQKISTAALGKLLRFAEEHEKARGGARVGLTNLSEYNYELISMTRLDDPSRDHYVEVDATVEDCVARKYREAA
jgi:hypothetical protein